MGYLKKLLSAFIVMLIVVSSVHVTFAEETTPPTDDIVETKDFSDLSVSLAKSSYTWTGDSINPAVTVKDGTQILSDETDYTVEYKDNVDLGTASVIVTAKEGSSYTGSKTVTFSIVRKNLTASITGIKTTSATVSFTRVPNAVNHWVKVLGSDYNKRYKTNNHSFTGLKAGKKYTARVYAYDKNGVLVGYGSKTFTTLPTVPNVTLSAQAGNEMALLTWKAVSGATGYQIYRSTKKSSGYTRIKTVSSKTKSYTNYLLTANKTYYYKVRSYKKTGKTYKYGKFSTVKAVKIKKSTRTTYYLRVNIRTNVTTVYAKNFSGKYVAVKAIATSCGKNGASKPILGTHYTQNKYRWKYMHEDCYTQYATRITGHYLFHSIPYSKAKANTLWYNSYNRLGNFASAGCIRMNVAGSKWIYDHCPLKTKVVVVYSKTDPLKKPKVKKISTRSSKKHWDPTDPSTKNPWKK